MSAYLVGFVGEKNDKAYFHRKMKDGTNFPTSIITLQISITTRRSIQTTHSIEWRVES
jgi:hypothetical protein